jgi:hypothetical protein
MSLQQYKAADFLVLIAVDFYTELVYYGFQLYKTAGAER